MPGVTTAFNKLAMICIVIVDDLDVTLEGIQSRLRDQKNFTIAGIASGTRELLTLLEEKETDIILISDHLLGITGAQEMIREKYPDVKILMMTKAITKKMEVRASHVHGIVLKNCSTSELIEALEEIHEKGNYFTAEAREIIFENARDERERDRSLIKPTNREIEILQLLDNAKSTQEIADLLHLTYSTVETYRKNLHSKYDVHSTTELLTKARDLKHIE